MLEIQASLKSPHYSHLYLLEWAVANYGRNGIFWQCAVASGLL